MHGRKRRIGCGLALSAAIPLLASSGCASTRTVQHARTDAARAASAATPAALSLRKDEEQKAVPYTSPEFGFQLDKPAGDAWALATNVTSPEGHPIPVVVAHPESGAQIVVQVSDPVQQPKELATMLRDKLQAESSMTLTKPERLSIDSGDTAYGFNFTVKGEANGRVAIIALGEQIVLLVASWPENADNLVVTQIDGIVKSVRSTKTGTAKAVLRPDKA